MRRIVNLPKSGEKTIFNQSPDQYFYITDSEISMLGGYEMANLSLNDLSVFRMGYTNLWLMSRVLLWSPEGIRFEYEESPAQSDLISKTDDSERIGKYYILGDASYLYFAERESTLQSKAFASPKEAEDYLTSCKDPGENNIFVVAKLLRDIYWH